MCVQEVWGWGGVGWVYSFLTGIIPSKSQLPWNPRLLVTLSLNQTASLIPWAMILKNAIRNIFCANTGFILCVLFLSVQAFLVAKKVKNLLAMWETQL